MNPFTAIIITAGIRILVMMFIDVMLYYFKINYIVVPYLGWKRDALEIMLTFVIATPIIAGPALLQ